MSSHKGGRLLEKAYLPSTETAGANIHMIVFLVHPPDIRIGGEICVGERCRITIAISICARLRSVRVLGTDCSIRWVITPVWRDFGHISHPERPPDPAITQQELLRTLPRDENRNPWM